MGSVLADVSDAVTTDLNLDPATNFGVTFTAVRSYGEWDEKLKEGLDDLQCDVVPVRYDEENLRRSGGYNTTQHHVSCHIALRKRLVRATGTELFTLSDIDDLTEALEKIARFFTVRELSTLDTAAFIESRIVTPYVRRHLREMDQYTGIVLITYEIVK